MKKYYIQALLEMIRTGTSPQEVLTGFAKLLKTKGHERVHVSVLQGVVRILEAESTRRGTVITVADTATLSQHQASIKKALQTMGVEDTFAVVEDASLIGGFIASAHNTVFDASYKTSLVKLYRTIAK